MDSSRHAERSRAPFSKPFENFGEFWPRIKSLNSSLKKKWPRIDFLPYFRNTQLITQTEVHENYIILEYQRIIELLRVRLRTFFIEYIRFEVTLEV